MPLRLPNVLRDAIPFDKWYATILGRSLLLVAAAAIPFLVLGAWIIVTEHDSLRAEIEGRLLDGAQGLAVEVDREFERGETALLALAASSALHRGDLDAFEREMRAVARRMDARIGLGGPDGVQTLNTVWNPGERRRNVLLPAEALRVFEDRRPAISDLFPGPSDGALLVSLTVPVFGPDAEDGAAPPPVRHVLGFIIPRDRFLAPLARATGHEQADGWLGVVFDRSARFVARSRADAEAAGEQALPATAERLARNGEGIARDRKDREGNPIVSAFARAPRTGYWTVLAAPEDAFYAPLRRMAWQSAGIASEVLAFCAGLAVFGSRRIAAAYHGTLRDALADAGGGGAIPAARSTGLREADALAAALADAIAQRDRATADFRTLFDVSPVGMVRSNTDGRITDANDAFLRMVGVERERMLNGGLRWDEITAPDLMGRNAEALAELLRHGRCEPFEKEYVRPDGGRVPVLAAFAFLDRERGEAAAFAVDLSGRKRAEAALAASEARLALAIAAAGMATWEWDCATDGLRGSAGLEALYGLEPGRLATGEDEIAAIHPDDRNKARLATDRLARPDCDTFDEQFRVVRPDGAVRWLHSIGRVTARDAAGAAGHVSRVAMDVTLSREEQARQELLAREVDHRAKNVLAVVQAVLKLTVAEDPKAFTRVVEGRIAALAHAHTLLARDRWTGAEVRALLDEELAPFLAGSEPDGGGGRRVSLDGPRVVLSPWVVQPFAMVLHELATNAAKHGALAHGGAALAVSWRLDKATGHLELRWEETGVRGPGRAPARRGFGTRVIDSTVRGQLRGSLVRDWSPDGLRCTLRVPPAQVAGAADLRPARPPARRRLAPGSARDLDGKRVLVVEDEAVLAQSMAASLSALGVEVVGPAGSLEDALRLAALEPGLDAAVLDVNLGGRFSYAVADVLAGRGVPTLFATGYASLPDDGIAERHTGVPLLRKPLGDDDLTQALHEITVGAAAVVEAAATPPPRPQREDAPLG